MTRFVSGVKCKAERRREDTDSTIDYDLIRRTVTAEEIASAYGLEVDRHHRARCPWHADRHPSLTLYSADHGGGCYCFACNRGGSCIDLAMQLLGVDLPTAARQIAEDFSVDGAITDGLSVADKIRLKQKRQEREAQKAEREAAEAAWQRRYNAACEALHSARSLVAAAEAELAKANLIHEAFPPPPDESLSDALDDPINAAFYAAADKVWDNADFRKAIKANDTIEKELVNHGERIQSRIARGNTDTTTTNNSSSR